MNISSLIDLVDKPKPYAKGTDEMWTDPHISTYLLKAHLDPDIGAASRTSCDIQETIDVIDRMLEPGSKVLDLGCGPGLYTERLREKGHHVTGVDFSKRSIDYAKEQDRHNDITYIHENYMNIDFDCEFDFIMMIYCDFGVLLPEERQTMIRIIKKALKPNGVFLFDAIDEGTVDKLSFSSSWEMSKSGFFSPDPYLCLTEGFHFSDYKATLDQHLVLNDDESTKLYRFWNHYFNDDDVKGLFLEHGFTSVESIRGVLKGDVAYHDEGVVFYAVGT